MPHASPQQSLPSPLGLALALAFVATATLGFNLSDHIYTADGLEQLAAAQCLIDGDSPCPGLAYWPPLLPTLIAALTPLLGSTEVAGRLLSLGAGGWVPGVVALGAARLLESLHMPFSRSLAALGGVGAFAVPALFFFASMVDNRPIYLLTLALSLTLGILYTLGPKPSLPLAGALGALGVIASLARPEGLALIPVLGVFFIVDTLSRPPGDGGRRGAGALVALVVAGVTYGLYGALLREGSGGVGISSRGWELPILHWQAYLDRGLILSLFGFTVEATPLREVMLTAVAEGRLPSPPLDQRLSAFLTIYWDHLPLVLKGLSRALPPWLMLLAPLGLAPLIAGKRWATLVLCLGLLGPLVLLPGLPQSADPNLPSGSFLAALPSLGCLGALGMGQLLAWVLALPGPSQWMKRDLPRRVSPWAVGGVAATLGALCLVTALKAGARFDEDFHLFEGEPLPRGAGIWLKDVAPEHARLVATYPGTIVAHVMGRPRTPMPSYWEMAQAMEDLSDRPNVFLVTSPDLYDDPLMVSALIKHIPDPCRPIVHLTGERGEWVFACMTEARR